VPSEREPPRRLAGRVSTRPGPTDPVGPPPAEPRPGQPRPEESRPTPGAPTPHRPAAEPPTPEPSPPTPEPSPPTPEPSPPTPGPEPLTLGAGPPTARRFLVARNPDPESSLPYLVWLPIEGGLALKVGDRWPRTSRVYCHRLEAWPEGAEILEDVPITVLTRRGPAIDLVLERRRENRSQFVFTLRPSGREAIFWQTRKVVATARPGARIPGRRAAGLPSFEILVDTREHYPYRFARQQVTTRRGALPAGDYGVCDAEGRWLAVVERKSLADLATALSDGTLVYSLMKLAELPRAAIVVEDRYSALLRQPYAAPGFLADLLARVTVRYPSIPIVFAETRPLAEEWTYRYLGAALAETLPAGPDPDLPPSRGRASPRRRRTAEPPDPVDGRASPVTAPADRQP
jgi:hypothetical protein